MCPRRRQIPDSNIAQLVGELLAERGAAAVSFAEVSKRCGLAPPTLVQRFGTREHMLAAGVAFLRNRLPSVFAQSGSLIDALQTLASEQHALLQVGLASETAAYSFELRKQISFCLTRMVEAGEMPRCDVAQLARMLQITFAGAVAAAVLEHSDTKREISAAINAQLDGYV